MARAGIVALVLLLPWVPVAGAEEPFYRGKTLTIVVGTKAGDAYDLYARLVGEHMTRLIPGQPRVLVQNMPGAGSLIAANHVYTAAKADGLTLAAFYPALYFDQLAQRSEVRFDWKRWGWIGSPVKSGQLLYMRADAPYASLDDVRRATVPPKCGATGRASSSYYLAKLLEETLDTRLDVVTGYPAGIDIDLAVERGEVQCRAFTITAYFTREPFLSWTRRGFVRVLVQTGHRRDPRLPDVPTLHELMDQRRTAAGPRRLATALLAAGEFGRPLAAPPGVPEERLALLREAFDRAIVDPQLLAEARRRRLEIDPTPHATLTALAHEVMATPPEVVARMRDLLGE
jgi:tripartite-type tricarboxylate transporter receptor subunit TctC